jgi:hypothetical protein
VDAQVDLNPHQGRRGAVRVQITAFQRRHSC